MDRISVCQAPLSNLQGDTNNIEMRNILVVAKRQKALLIVFLVYFFIAGFSGSVSSEIKPLLQLTALPLMLLVVIFTARLTLRLYGKFGAIMMIILSIIPLINLLVVLAANSRANKIIKNGGFRVGFVGASIKEIEDSMFIAEQKNSDQAVALREAYLKESNSPGCLAFVIGGLSFIPLIGIIFGTASIIWGFSVKNTKLKIVGSLGIAFTVILYSSLGYFGLVQEDGVYDELRQEMANTQLNSVIQAIEFYKIQNAVYPDSLKTLQESLPENSMVFLSDPTQINAEEGAYYFYDLISEQQYHIRALGRDGVLNTDDDVLPTPMENIGLTVDYTK